MTLNRDRTLLIGCGEIGALMDINHKSIKTHLKVLKFLGIENIDVIDPSDDNIQKAREVYNFNVVKEIEIDLYNLVIISSPTNTHYKYLKLAMESNIEIIICEKPISLNLAELEYLDHVKKQSSSKVFINYIRQFNPEFNLIKSYLDTEKQKNNNLKKISVSYTRGLINNGSHALNLIHYLYNFSKLSEFVITDIESEIVNDPTISCFMKLDENIPTYFMGLGESTYNFFEINLFLRDTVIKISESGNTIDFYECVSALNNVYKSELVYNIERSKKEVLQDYMLSAYKVILASHSDNLDECLYLNKILLEISQSCQN